MSGLPDLDALRAWIAENPEHATGRDIARAFGVKGADRRELRRMMDVLEAEGTLEPRRRTGEIAAPLPPVAVLEVTGPDAAGDLTARPATRSGAGAPRILVRSGRDDPALGAGDRILARLTPADEEGGAWTARPIRRLGRGPRKVLGIFRKGADGGRILPVEKGAETEWRVPAGAIAGARDGELVEAEEEGSRSRLGLPVARITARLGDPAAPRSVSLIAIRQHGIPDVFSPVALAAAEAATPPPEDEREDLRGLPFVTIDPADARDRDDAVHAHPDEDPANPGGHILWVAIADVAAHVRPGTALDREARARGNSTYFPDRVVPMLPERLSGDLCSLHEGVDRAVIAVRMKIDAHGAKRSHRFVRGVIRSRASLAYGEVQAAADGTPSARTAPLMDEVIAPLYAAYRALAAARERRQPLDLDLPERKIVLDAEGRVVSVAFAERLDAHRLIEEFMVLANVAAAEELTRLRRPLLFRVHEEPNPEKIEALRQVAEASGFTLAKGQVLKTRHLNALLAQAEGTDFDELLNITTLRSMTQAFYHPSNFGHFGLALASYAHFTSPIRRYADLVVHRALITAHGWGPDGLSPDEIDRLEDTARHISETERRSMAAERDTADRYLAAWLSERVGAEFSGRISGVVRFGVFVKLDETGADGLIPVRSLGREYFRFDPDAQTLTGEDTGLVLGIGQRVTVRLAEAVPTTGGLVLDLLSTGEGPLPRGGKRGRGVSGGRKAAPAKLREARLRRKAERRRRAR
jgi:ribonuclease R